MAAYVIGIDFGTLSGRTILVDVHTGEECAESVFFYPHAVMDEALPNGQKLPPNYALQHPQDYLDVLRVTVPDVMRQVGACAEDVLGLGIDFTACTLLPVDANGTPLCMKAEYRDRMHAYVKLWKHHAAQSYADEINALAEARGEEWLKIYGGKISCEWALPKILQVLREDPELYRSTVRFTEAADWLSLVLTGTETHSAAFAGYKALWNAETGYPSNAFMTALDPALDGIVGSKLSTRVLGMKEIAGRLDRKGAELTGLKAGTPVALPMIDAHAAMPAINLTEEGALMMILGTSACHILNAREARNVEGICGYVKDGVIPGFYTYEAGQAGVGDVYDWFVRNCVPQSYCAEAVERGIGLHQLLRERVCGERPGECGLLALDWLNGNRSILVNSDLRGMILGLNLQTRPEQIYRALIEATAYGLRIIMEQYEKSGIPVNRICAAGGIAKKDGMMMQIYADVLNREIAVADSTQAAALGSAMYASVAAGAYPNIQAAAEKLSKPCSRTYLPDAQNAAVYDLLYREYKTLHDYFGKENAVMLRLRKWSAAAKQE
ncbi:MAG: ribulokinase [Clostridia bacterium]|nr:ribulokinase [Clostridia bacterium]